jgi:hypothetical protein
LSNPTYQPGEHVRVTIDAHVDTGIDAADPAGTLLSLTLLHGGGSLDLNPRAPGVAVTRVAPADGMPQPGELWADRHGTEWYAAYRNHRNGAPSVYLHTFDGRAYPWREIHADDRLGPIRRVRLATPVPAVPQHETAVL